MLNNVPFLLLLISIAIAAVCLAIAVMHPAKVQPALPQSKPYSPITFIKSEGNEVPTLIDHPVAVLSADAEVFIEKVPDEYEANFEAPADNETLLLKAAEIIVEKVQDITSHIASDPPNPEEIKSKIKAIISPYKIFHDTEYFDAINSFIALTAERDCQIKFTKEELLSLWD